MAAAKFRRFADADRGALEVVRAAAFAPVFDALRQIVGPAIAPVAFATAETEQVELLEGLMQANPDQEIWVACVDDNLVGFVAISFDHDQSIGEIRLMAVHPDHGGGGIGTDLNQLALRRMKACGMRLATVGTGGDDSHAPARRAYEKVGFRAYIPSRFYYADLDALDD